MKQKILMVVSLLFGLLFINSGLNKFFNYMPVPDDLPEHLLNLMNHLMQIGWLMPLIAIAEISGGILVIFSRTRALGAIILFPIVIGILLTHLIQAPSGLPLAVIILAVLLWILWENRAKLKVLF